MTTTMTEPTSKPKRAKASKSKPVEAVVNTADTASHQVGKSDIRSAALSAWAKLDAVIQTELDAVKDGSKELNASLVTSIVKYIEASVDISRSNEDLSPKDAADRAAKLYSLSDLPTFDDEGDYNNNSKGG